MTTNDLFTWVPLGAGVAVGLIMGIATDKLVLWLPVGLAVGAAYAARYSRRSRSD